VAATTCAFYGWASTEDHQDPEVSRSWQLARALNLIAPAGGRVVAEYFDVAVSRSLPWKRRPQAAQPLEEVRGSPPRFDAVVVGEPQRAFYGNQFAMVFPGGTAVGCCRVPWLRYRAEDWDE